MHSIDRKQRFLAYAPFWFLAGRMVLLLSLPFEGLKSYGDFWNFIRLSSLGWPFLDFWVEYPPIFPLLSRSIFLLTGGKEHVFVYTTAIMFSLVQALNIYLFSCLVKKSSSMDEWGLRAGFYGFLLIGLFYGWTYFDCLGVMFLLLSIHLALKKRNLPAGAAMGLGALLKWFPVLVFPAHFKWLKPKKAFQAGLMMVGMILIVWGAFYIVSPDFTTASLVSQGAKGSWETVWALVDGNWGTGNFPAGVDRFDPLAAGLPAGNSPRISPYLTLPFFLLIGIVVMWKAEIDTEQKFVAFTGFTFVLFLLWSPGYSPQWMLYLLPLILLALDFERSMLLGIVIVLVNLLEWPILLSRGLFQYLGLVIGLRTVIYLFLAALFAQKVLGPDLLPMGGRSGNRI